MQNFANILRNTQPFYIHNLKNKPTFIFNLINIKLYSISVNEMESITRFHIEDGKFRGCEDVYKRFKRLDWGIWIRTKSGHAKRRWKMSQRQKTRSLAHVFCRGTQSKKLDLLAGKDFIREKYYVDDPYERFHKRYFNGPLPRAVSSYYKHILNNHYQTDIY